MKKIICDSCGKDTDENYNYSIGIGAFHARHEISVNVSFLKGGTGINRWEDVDLCQGCKDEALSIAVCQWTKEIELMSAGHLQHLTHYPKNIMYQDGVRKKQS